MVHPLFHPQILRGIHSYLDNEACKSKMRENILGCKNGGYPDPKKQCGKCRCQDGFKGKKCEKLAKNGKFEKK